MDETAEKQVPKQLKAYAWKKGQTGNPNGRPKGKTLKEFAREYLQSLPDDEKVEYLASLPTDIVWKMAEGNPHSTEDHKVEVTLPAPIAPIVRDILPDLSIQQDSDAG